MWSVERIASQQPEDTGAYPGLGWEAKNQQAIDSDCARAGHGTGQSRKRSALGTARWTQSMVVEEHRHLAETVACG